MNSFFKKKKRQDLHLLTGKNLQNKLSGEKKKQGAKQYKTCFHWPLEKKDWGLYMHMCVCVCIHT